MANELVKILKTDSIAALKSEIADFERKRRAEATRNENALTERRGLALAAERGDKDARDRIEKINAGLPGTRTRLTNIELAITDLNGLLAVAKAKASQDVALAKLDRLKAALKKRLTAFTEQERLWRELQAALDLGAAATAEILKLHKELRLTKRADGGPAGMLNGLTPAMILQRLTEFLCSIGLDNHVRLRLTVTAEPGLSLTAGERAAQREYELSEAEVQHRVEVDGFRGEKVEIA